MGWTCVYSVPANKKAFLDAEFTGGKWKIIKSAMVGSVYYAAIECSAEAAQPGVWGLVALTKGGGGQILYKEMDEFMGPAESKCPADILSLLSPTDNEYALAWRSRCGAGSAQQLCLL